MLEISNSGGAPSNPQSGRTVLRTTKVTTKSTTLPNFIVFVSNDIRLTEQFITEQFITEQFITEQLLRQLIGIMWRMLKDKFAAGFFLPANHLARCMQTGMRSHAYL
jgi:hypothetical protein